MYNKKRLSIFSLCLAIAFSSTAAFADFPGSGSDTGYKLRCVGFQCKMSWFGVPCAGSNRAPDETICQKSYCRKSSKGPACSSPSWDSSLIECTKVEDCEYEKIGRCVVVSNIDGKDIFTCGTTGAGAPCKAGDPHPEKYCTENKPACEWTVINGLPNGQCKKHGQRAGIPCEPGKECELPKVLKCINGFCEERIVNPGNGEDHSDSSCVGKPVGEACANAEGHQPPPTAY